MHSKLIAALFFTLVSTVFAVSPEESFDSANALYAKADYANAAASFQQIIDDGHGSPDIYYNLGNALFRSEKRGEAALAWRRALHIDPQHVESRQNLGFLGRKAGFLDFQSEQRFFGDYLSSNQWITALSISIWIIVLSAASLLLLKLRAGWIALPVTLSTLAVTAIFVSLFAIRATSERTPSPDRAVIVAEEVKAYTEPSTSGESVISLPPGSEVNVLLKRESWTYVDIPGTLRGWVESDAIQRLNTA